MSEDKKPDEKNPDEKKETLKTQKTTENTEKGSEKTKEPSVPSETFSDLSVQKKSSESKKTKEKSKKVKVSGKLAKIIEEIEKLSVLELNELVKALEEKFGVSATPMAAAGVATSSTPSEAGAAAISQQTTFNVILASSGANKISVIKAVREVKQDMGLKDAKDFVEAAPKELLTGVNKETAEEAKKKLEAAGATVELK